MDTDLPEGGVTSGLPDLPIASQPDSPVTFRPDITEQGYILMLVCKPMLLSFPVTAQEDELLDQAEP